MASPRRSNPNVNRPEDTRMQRDRLNAEKEKAQAERTSNLTMATATSAADNAEGVWDPDTGELLEAGMADETYEAMRAAQQVGGDDDVIEDATRRTISSTTTNTGPAGIMVRGPQDAPNDDIEDLASQEAWQEVHAIEDALAVPETPGPRSPQIVTPMRQERTYVVRINADIEPTIGRGNTYTLKKGRRYKLPEHVVNHLDEKGYISVR